MKLAAAAGWKLQLAGGLLQVASRRLLILLTGCSCCAFAATVLPPSSLFFSSPLVMWPRWLAQVSCSCSSCCWGPAEEGNKFALGLLLLGCPIFASYFFLLRSETKQNRNRCASFSHNLAKLINKFFASFRFFSLQFFRFVWLQLFSTPYLEGSKDDTENGK